MPGHVTYARLPCFRIYSNANLRQTLSGALSRCAASLDGVDPEPGAVGACEPHLLRVEEAAEVLPALPASNVNLHLRMDGISDRTNRRWVTATAGDPILDFPSAHVASNGLPFSNQFSRAQRTLTALLSNKRILGFQTSARLLDYICTTCGILYCTVVRTVHGYTSDERLLTSTNLFPLSPERQSGPSDSLRRRAEHQQRA